MIFLILLVVFSYVIHKMCADRGISPWKHLIGFVTGFFLVLFATSFAIVMVYGQSVMSDPDVEKKVMVFAPFAMLFQFLLFVFFRIKIARVRVPNNEDDEPTLPKDGEKKDLSYFR
ncbi:MAG: hypothetical protein V4615_06575 [Bacteroidota bacterium]